MIKWQASIWVDFQVLPFWSTCNRQKFVKFWPVASSRWLRMMFLWLAAATCDDRCSINTKYLTRYSQNCEQRLAKGKSKTGFSQQFAYILWGICLAFYSQDDLRSEVAFSTGLSVALINTQWTRGKSYYFHTKMGQSPVYCT